MKKNLVIILLTIFVVSCTSTSTSNQPNINKTTTEINNISFEPTKIKKEFESNSKKQIGIVTINNNSSEDLEFETTSSMYLLDESGKKLEVVPAKHSGGLGIWPSIGVSLGSGGFGGGVGVSVGNTSSRKEESKGVTLEDKFLVKANNSADLIIGFDFSDLVLKVDKDVKVNAGTIVGDVYLVEKKGKNKTVSIPYEINLK